MNVREMSFETIVMTVALLATNASAQVQSAAQQKCLNGMTAALTKIAKAQQGVVSACCARRGELQPLGATRRIPLDESLWDMAPISHMTSKCGIWRRGR